MRNDLLGQQLLNEMDLCDLFLSNPTQVIKHALIIDQITFDDNLLLDNLPMLKQYEASTATKQEFDTNNQS